MRSDSQLAELRAKTDFDLGNLFQRALDRSLHARDRCEWARAESEYIQATTLLTVATGLPEETFRALWIRLAELRTDLDKRTEPCALLCL
jgi:hypothetical protein